MAGSWGFRQDSEPDRQPLHDSGERTSQSVKTAGQGGPKGYDAGKKVAGRKRYIWVDSLGLLLAVAVTGAGAHDAHAACDLLHRRLWDDLPRLRVVYADGRTPTPTSASRTGPRAW